MILMWLGSFVLMMFGLMESQKHIAAFFSHLQKGFLEKGLDTSFAKMLIRALDVVVLEASPQKSLYAGMAMYNLRIAGLRSSSLVMCLSLLGAWWALILGFLYLSFNGYFLLGLCALGLLNIGEAPRLQILLKWLFATGVFLIGGETMLRNSSVLQTLLGQSDLAFFLADGRFESVTLLLLAGIVLSFLIRVEFWSLVLGLSLLTTNTISFNGALALLAGERIGRMVLFWWRSRSLSRDCHKIGWQLALSSSGGVLVGFFIAGAARGEFYFGFSSSISVAQDKSLQLILLFMVILLFQFVGQMTWGHFFSQTESNEMADPRYIPASWIRQELVTGGVLAWAQERVHKRLSEIRYHLQGLGTLKEGQVPDSIQSRLKEEERQLAQLLH